MPQPAATPLKTVLITGCSAGGAGSALVEAFHERGLHVFATARSLSKMAHLEKLPNVTLLELDVVSPSSISAAIETVTAKTGGKLDYLVNNSGQACVRPALDTDLERARKLFDVNFWGTVNVIHAFAPLIIASKGMIVNICSIAAVLHTAWGAFYNSSKAAVRSYSESLRLEMAPLGVKVMTVMAGTLATNVFANHPDPQLPENSLWKAASKEITTTASGSLTEGAMLPSEFARRVVGDVLAGVNGLTWRGKLASIGWFIQGFMPTWVMDRMLVSTSGLEHMA
ncbi:hypothetical protein NUU61_006640 [Penicillium alfredii]|uniref:Uncharacterized protein n=1 Tax=Penicillium alfredii TaxID=1506179 RepID=A0A9W9K3T7_9EURO|nr:uncharacterized protein NUU61_006640 [Penicillium alfredii]KAJ5091770.1 hypothetical protein NUU61_006640 [Penicillium alfredii]